MSKICKSESKKNSKIESQVKMVRSINEITTWLWYSGLVYDGSEELMFGARLQTLVLTPIDLKIYILEICIDCDMVL